MARLLRVHVTVFAVFLSVYSPVNGISNIFKSFSPLFDLTLSSNDTSTNTVNVTVRQGIYSFSSWLPCAVPCYLTTRICLGL